MRRLMRCGRTGTRRQDPARQAMEAAGLDLSDRDYGRVEDAIDSLSDEL